MVCLIEYLWNFTVQFMLNNEWIDVLHALFFIRGRGGSKILRNINGGSCQMLTIDDKRGGRGVKNLKNLLT